MQENRIHILKKSSLCRNMTEDEINHLEKNHHSGIKQFHKGELIFTETDNPGKVFVLLSGSVVVAKDTLAGKRMILTRIDQPGELFGEIYAFMETGAYGMYAQAQEKTVIMALEKTIFQEEEDGTEFVRKLRNNLMEIFARKAYTMNCKLKVLGGSSIREKITRFLIERQDKDGTISGSLSREEMADYLNVTRPSLSRELSNMVKEGILQMEGGRLAVRNQEALEEYL